MDLNGTHKRLASSAVESKQSEIVWAEKLACALPPTDLHMEIALRTATLRSEAAGTWFQGTTSPDSLLQ